MKAAKAKGASRGVLSPVEALWRWTEVIELGVGVGWESCCSNNS
jgi:hypothetical protein